jgi:hypothetical protein
LLAVVESVTKLLNSSGSYSSNLHKFVLLVFLPYAGDSGRASDISGLRCICQRGRFLVVVEPIGCEEVAKASDA